MIWTIFAALAAGFQNNQEIRRMLSTINNFEWEIGDLLSVRLDRKNIEIKKVFGENNISATM